MSVSKKITFLLIVSLFLSSLVVGGVVGTMAIWQLKQNGAMVIENIKSISAENVKLIKTQADKEAEIYRKELMDHVKEYLKAEVQTTMGLFDYVEAQSGIKAEQKKAIVATLIQGLRYGPEVKDYFWINDMAPVMIMHPYKPELNGKDLSENKDPAGKKLFMEFVDVCAKNGEGFVDYLWPKYGADKPQPKMSFVKLYKPWNWVIGTGVYIDQIDGKVAEKRKEADLAIAAITKQMNQQVTKIEQAIDEKTSWIITLIVMVTVGLSIIVVAVVSFVSNALISHGFTESLESGVNLAESIANGDLSHEDIAVHSSDEIGSLASALNKMKEAIKSIIGKLAGATKDLMSSSKELSTVANDLSHSVASQTSLTNQVATSITQMSKAVFDIAKNSSTIASSADDTARVAKAGEDIVEKSVAEVKTIARTVTESADTMKFLADRSRQIGEIVDVINDIADQTNLLALNAAIEAASAGEHGRGFAVVADEVRQLAKRTASATSEISKMIKDIQQDVQKAVTTMESASANVETGVMFATQAGEALRNIVGSVDELQVQINQIATATEEMSSVSEQVSGDVQSIAKSVQEVSSGYQNIIRSSNGLSGLATTLHEIVGQFRI